MMRASAASSPDAHGGHGKQAEGLQAPSNGKRPSIPLSVFRECAVDGSTQLALDLQRPRAASGLSQFPVSNAQSPGPNSAFCLSLDRHPSHDLHPFVVLATSHQASPESPGTRPGTLDGSSIWDCHQLAPSIRPLRQQPIIVEREPRIRVGLLPGALPHYSVLRLLTPAGGSNQDTSAISPQPSAISHQPSAIGHPPSSDLLISIP